MPLSELDEKILGAVGNEWVFSGTVSESLGFRDRQTRLKVTRHLRSLATFGYLEESVQQFGRRFFYAYRRKQ